MSLLLIAAAVIILLLCTLFLRKSLLVSAAAAFTSILLILVVSNQFQATNVLSSVLHGLLVAVEIGLLVFGALLFFNYLKATGFTEQLKSSIHHFSANSLIIVIILAFFFGSFIEGVSGFGTPGMIIAPLLLGLRYSPLLTAALPLLANTVPVIFGAAGTPVKIGFAGFAPDQTATYAALLLILPAVMIPFIFKLFLDKHEPLANKSNRGKNIFIVTGAGICFIIPFILFSNIAPEFPSIAAAVCGLVLWLLLIKLSGNSLAVINNTTIKGFLITFRPYLLIALLLVIAKFVLGNLHFSISWPAAGLQKSINVFQPGLLFIIGLFLLILLKKKKQAGLLTGAVKQTAQRMPATFVTIALLAILARLLSQNQDLSGLFGSNNIPLPLFYVGAVFTGFLGSYIAGSATVSNLMFGTEWYAVGQQLHLNIPVLLAAQLAGAALGNALSVQNIAMVQAVLNEKGLERSIFKKLWKPVLLFFICICASAVVVSLLWNGQ